MIVRSQEQMIVCIAQHDHAQLSGWIAACWGSKHVPSLPEPKSALITATLMHDIGWIPLDEKPLWNEAANEPYSFVNLPAAIRVHHYQVGVDQVERVDDYAALLCSLHYTTFFPPPSAVENQTVRKFLQNEQLRQQRLATRLEKAGRFEEVNRQAHDLALLKLWDSMSLYVALNEPGVSKSEEHPWYKDGLPPVTLEATGSTKVELRIQARWYDEERVVLDPFPFQDPLVYPLPVRKVSVEQIRQKGFETAYRMAATSIQMIRFIPEVEYV